MKIAHEAPLSIFDEVQAKTDYDYCLVNLLEENQAYEKKFHECVAKGREVILDNAIFELGEAFEPNAFAMWVRRMKPTWYIIPDVLEDSKGTIANYNQFIHDHKDLPGKSIAVVQGKSYEEVVRCYKFFEQEYRLGSVGKIAISFDYSFYETLVDNAETKYHKWSLGRQLMLQRMLDEGVINTDIPHHLLGAGLPQEFAYYRNWDWIDSIDTSNPVVHGILGIEYERQPQYDIYGLDNKESVKLFTLIDDDVTKKIKTINYNIDKFKYNTVR